MITDIFTAVSANTAIASVTSKIGAEFLDELDVAPVLVWVPTSDTFTPGSRITSTSSTFVKEPRQIGIRTAGVRVRVWAAGDGTVLGDIFATEDLLRKFLVAVHETTFGSYRVQSMTWIGQDGGEIAQLGRVCDVSLTFDVPVFKDARMLGTLAVITTNEMSGAEAFPAGDVTRTPPP
jgi:hypothetical protein